MLHGKPIRQALRTTEGARAEAIMQALEAGRSPYAAAPIGRTVGTAAAEFLKACAGRNVRASTMALYKRTIEWLDGSMPLNLVDAPFLEAHRAGRPIGPRSWQKELQILRIFFAWCLDRKWISDNPAKRLKMPHVDDLPTLPFTAEEVRSLLAACDQIASAVDKHTARIRRRARALVLVMLYSGLRVSDVARLRRAALETTGHLVLRVLKTGVRLKVLLHPDAVAALISLPSSNPEYFFWTGRGKLVVCKNAIEYTIRRLGKIAGIRAHPHRFRDTFAVELLTQGADIRTVQKLLGHTSIRITEKHYAHFVAAHQELLDSATARLDFERRGGHFPVHLVSDRLRDAK